MVESGGLVEPIGCALNASNSMLNNSCDVNTYKYHVGSATFVVANRDVDKGEEVTDFYGQHYSRTER